MEQSRKRLTIGSGADPIPRIEIGAKIQGRAGAVLGRLAKTLGSLCHSSIRPFGTMCLMLTIRLFTILYADALNNMDIHQ